jgi:hypothetical protein
MSDIILYALALTLFQIWLLPHRPRRGQSSRDAANFSDFGTPINDDGYRQHSGCKRLAGIAPYSSGLLYLWPGDIAQP